MNTIESEKSVSKKFNLGNYLSAEKQFRELLNNSEDFEDKIYFRNKIADCKEFGETAVNLAAGEAFFPVFDQTGNNSSVLTIRITKSPSGTKTFDIENIRSAVIKFLDDYLFKEIRTIMVLDWKTEDLKAEIKEIPNINNDFREFTESIEGRSYELAAAIALISKILDVKISADYVFSGGIKADGENVKLLPVERIKEKLDCIKTERPDLKKFIVPMSVKMSDKIISRKDKLSEVVSEVFENFNTDLENSLSKLNKFTLVINESETEDNQKVLIFNFNHGTLRNGNRIPEYFKNIHKLLIGREEGMIIDGFKPAFLSPMLISMQEVANHISNFIAVRHGDVTGDFATATVVRTNNTNTSTYKVGDTFRYKLSQK